MNVGDLVDAGHAEIKTGPFGTQLRASDYVREGRPVLNVRNVGFGHVRPKDLEFVDEATASRLSSHLLKPNDIVFGRKGAVERHAFINEKYDGAMQGSDCIRLRISNDSPMPARFLTFALRTKQHQAWMQAFCSHGATMASLNQDIVRQIPLPEVDQAGQDLAVAVLQNIDDLIENIQRRLEVLEEMARAIYREWFVNFRYPGHGDVSLVDSSLGPIPEGWVLAPASAAITINPRIKLDKAVQHPFITMGDLDERNMGCRPSQFRSGGSGSKFAQGDTLFARITPCLENGKTGLVQSLAEGVIGLGSTEFVVLRGRDVGSAFTYCLAREDGFRKHAIASMSGASGRQRVRNECFDSYLFAVPPRQIADAFESTTEPLFSQAAVLLDEAVRLEALRDLLLPKLVTGQIDVSTLDLNGFLVEQGA